MSELKLNEFRIPIDFIKDKYRIKKDTSTDLELNDQETSVYCKIFDATDGFKKLVLDQHASWYTTDTSYLNDTQTILKNEIPSIPDYDNIMKFHTNIVNPDDFRDKYNYIGWDKLHFINKSSQALQYMSIYNISAPALSLAMPVIMLLIPFFMIRIQDSKFTWETYNTCLQHILRNHSLGQLFNFRNVNADKKIMIITSLLFYLVQIYFNTQSCVRFVKNMIEVHDHVFCVRNYIKHTIDSFKHIEDKWRCCNSYLPFIDKCSEISKKASLIYKELDNISALKLSITKIGDIGRVMRIYYMINIDQDWKDTIDYCIYFNSYISSMACLKTKLSTTIKFCKYSKKTSFKGLVYPMLPKADAVGNNVALDKNIIITGPNAAGKTTTIKAIMINVILCQQYGCGYFVKATINPYHVLSSYINIPDTSGRDSLFQAEATRCKTILNDIESDPKIRHLCIFDELFSGTNPYEAISAATAYLKFIGEKKNIDFILTTHFLDLCRRLDKIPNVKNMQMQVHEENDDCFNYTYKILRGISNIKGGIKVLRDLDYPPCIIKESTNIIKDLKL